MKTTFKYILALALVLPLSSSCSKWLEEHPKAIAVDTFYNSKDDADAAVASLVNRMRSVYAAAEFVAFNECHSDYMYGRGTWEPNSMYNVLTVTNRGRTDGIWTNLYRIIRDANIAIAKLPEATQLSDAQKSAYVAEAKFFRAFAYFDLVRYWNNVPLRTEENMDEFNMGLTPAAQIWEFIIGDLKDAVANCPDKPVLVGRPGKNVARTLLADAYMTRKEYSEAKKLLKEIIDSKEYDLVPVSKSRDFDNIFGYKVTGSKEEVFYCKTSRTSNLGWTFVMFTAHPNAVVNGGKMHNSGGWYATVTSLDNKWIKEWDTADLRKDFNILEFPSMGKFEQVDLNALAVKYYDPDAGSSGGATCDNPIYRYADVLMMYAEAINETEGPTSEAMECLNMIHRRGYGYPAGEASPVDFKLSDYSSKQAFMDVLTKEQCYEFFAEGKRWPFLVRTGQAEKYIKEYKGKTIDKSAWLYPIPDTEFTYNEALDPEKDQNPGF